MDFGFVGSEREWRRLQSRLDAQGASRVVAIMLDPPSMATAAVDHADPFDAVSRSVREFRDFEDLLTVAPIGAVILGGASDVRADRLRRIVQHGHSCLCLAAAHSDAILLHEVALIAADNRVVVMPWLPARLHPAWTELLARAIPHALGAVQSVLIECMGRIPAGRALMASSYAEAADLLSILVGEISEVTATGDLSAGRLIVQHRMATGRNAEIRLAPTASEFDRWRLTVEAQRGVAELTWEAGCDGPATLRWRDESGNHESVHGGTTPNQGMLAEFERAVRGEAHTIHWSDALRAAELADATWLSLERRRSVDVFHEKRNELASFKGRMTSLGCGLIWFTLCMLILVAAGKGLQVPGTDLLAAATSIVWLVFLGLQALRWVFPANQAASRPERPSVLSYLVGMFLAMFLIWLLLRAVVLR